MDPGGGAGGVIDVVRAALGSKPSFPVGGDVGLWLGKGGHGRSGRIGERKGGVRWRSSGKRARVRHRIRRRWFILRLSHIGQDIFRFLLFTFSRLLLLCFYHIYNRRRPDSIRGDRHHQPSVHRIRLVRPALQIIRNNFVATGSQVQRICDRNRQGSKRAVRVSSSRSSLVEDFHHDHRSSPQCDIKVFVPKRVERLLDGARCKLLHAVYRHHYEWVRKPEQVSLRQSAGTQDGNPHSPSYDFRVA